MKQRLKNINNNSFVIQNKKKIKQALTNHSASRFYVEFIMNDGRGAVRVRKRAAFQT